MADRVAVFNQGRLEQFGPPSEIYDQPRTLFVNTFVGSANTLTGTVKALSGSDVTVDIGAGTLLPARAVSAPLAIGDRVVVCIRPEQLRIVSGTGAIDATVEVGLPLGSMIVHEVHLPTGQSIKVATPREAGAEPLVAGTKVGLAPASPRAATVFLA